MTITRAPALLCSLLIAASVAAQDAPAALPDGAALLDEMEKRDAASAKIDKIHSVTSKGQCSLVIMGQGDPSTGPYEEYVQGGKYHMSADYGNFLLVEGSDGNVVWQIDPMSGAVIKEGDDAEAERRLIGMTLGDSWRDHFDAAKCVGARTLDGKPCWVLSMKARRGRDETWYIDQKAVQIVGLDMFKYSPGGSSEIEVRLANWKKVDGIPYAFTVEVHVEQADVMVNLESVEHNREIPDKQFALPKLVQKLVKAKPMKVTPELKVRILEIREQHVVSMRLSTDMAKIGNALAVAIPEVHRYLTVAGAQMVGPPFTRYHSIADDKMDIEVGFPVAKPVKGKGRIIASTLPGGEVAEVWHVGPYDKLSETYEQLEKWFASHKDEGEAGDARWEVYWTDPGREPDPSKWRTQIRWTVK